MSNASLPESGSAPGGCEIVKPCSIPSGPLTYHSVKAPRRYSTRFVVHNGRNGGLVLMDMAFAVAPALELKIQIGILKSDFHAIGGVLGGQMICRVLRCVSLCGGLRAIALISFSQGRGHDGLGACGDLAMHGRSGMRRGGFGLRRSRLRPGRPGANQRHGGQSGRQDSAADKSRRKLAVLSVWFSALSDASSRIRLVRILAFLKRLGNCNTAAQDEYCEGACDGSFVIGEHVRSPNGQDWGRRDCTSGHKSCETNYKRALLCSRF